MNIDYIDKNTITIPIYLYTFSSVVLNFDFRLMSGYFLNVFCRNEISNFND